MERVTVRNKRFDEHSNEASFPSLSIPPPPRARLFSSLESRPSRRRNVDKGFNSVRMNQRVKIRRLDRMGWKEEGREGDVIA